LPETSVTVTALVIKLVEEAPSVRVMACQSKVAGSIALEKVTSSVVREVLLGLVTSARPVTIGGVKSMKTLISLEGEAFPAPSMAVTLRR